MRERETRWRAKAQAQGRKQIACWLDAETYEALQALAKSHGLRGMGEAISLLVDSHQAGQEPTQGHMAQETGTSPESTDETRQDKPKRLERTELPGQCECVTAKGARCKGNTHGSITRTVDGVSVEFAACSRHNNWKAQPARSVVRGLLGLEVTS